MTLELKESACTISSKPVGSHNLSEQFLVGFQNGLTFNQIIRSTYFFTLLYFAPERQSHILALNTVTFYL